MGEISVLFAVEAEQLLLTEMYEEAIDLCYEGLKLYPEYASAYSIIARALLKLGKKKSAITTIDNAINQFPSNKLLKSVKEEIENSIERGEDAFANSIPNTTAENDPFAASVNNSNSAISDKYNEISESYSAKPDSMEIADSFTNNEHSPDLDSIFSTADEFQNSTSADGLDSLFSTVAESNEEASLDDINNLFAKSTEAEIENNEEASLDDIDNLFAANVDSVTSISEEASLEDIDNLFAANVETETSISEEASLDDIDNLFASLNKPDNIEESNLTNENEYDSDLFDNMSNTYELEEVIPELDAQNSAVMDFHEEIEQIKKETEELKDSDSLIYENDGIVEYTIISAEEEKIEEEPAKDIFSELFNESEEENIDISEFDETENISEFDLSIENIGEELFEEELEEKPIIEGHISSDELMSNLTAKLNAVNAQLEVEPQPAKEEIVYEKYNFAESTYEDELGEVNDDFFLPEPIVEAELLIPNEEDEDEEIPNHLIHYVGAKGFVNKFSISQDLFDMRIKARKLDLVPGLDNSPIRDRRQQSKRIYFYQSLPQEPDFCIQNEIIKEHFEDFSSLFGFKSNIEEDNNTEIVESNEPKRELITETIANIYVLQGAYSEAIKAYSELAEIYPDKREHFERKIKDAQAKEEALIKD